MRGYPGGAMISAEQGAFRALADPTRRQILKYLGAADMTIAEISGRFDMTRGAIKKHLVILEEGQLISVRTAGRERINHLEPQAMKSVSDWLGYFDRFWEDRLDDLKTAIENEQRNKRKIQND